VSRTEQILQLSKYIEQVNQEVKAKAAELSLDAHVDCWAFETDRPTFEQLPARETHHAREGASEAFWTKKVGRVTFYCHEAPISHDPLVDVDPENHEWVAEKIGAIASRVELRAMTDNDIRYAVRLSVDQYRDVITAALIARRDQEAQS
jgi:hypothetical protein